MSRIRDALSGASLFSDQQTNPSPSGQGALTGALPFFSITRTERTEEHDAAKSRMEGSRPRPCGLDLRQAELGCVPIHGGRARSGNQRHDHGSSRSVARAGCGTQSQRLNIFGYGALTIAISFFLLPRERWRGKAHGALPLLFLCFAPGLFRARNTKSVAADLILRFSRRMIRADKPGSKLCADKPRHAQVMRLSAACLRSTWQGGGNPLRCILPLCRRRHVKTLPVSTPSALRSAAAFRSWAVRP